MDLSVVSYFVSLKIFFFFIGLCYWNNNLTSTRPGASLTSCPPGVQVREVLPAQHRWVGRVQTAAGARPVFLLTFASFPPPSTPWHLCNELPTGYCFTILYLDWDSVRLHPSSIWFLCSTGRIKPVWHCRRGSDCQVFPPNAVVSIDPHPPLLLLLRASSSHHLLGSCSRRVQRWAAAAWELSAFLPLYNEL